MYRTDDPIADFNQIDWEQAKWLRSKPTCERCGEAIQQERAVCIDGFWYCDECLDELRRDVDSDE